MQTTGNSPLIEKIFAFSRLMKDQMCYDTGLLHLSLLQIQTLLFLHHNPSVHMRDIAMHFKIEMPTATNLISKLVREQLVTRRQDANDRRLVRIVLTEKGQKLLSDAMRERNQKLSLILAYLPTKDQDNLLRIISLLTAKMEISDEK